MAYFFKKDSMEFKPHPRFKGVGFLPLIDKAQDQGLGVSMLEIEPGIEIPIHIHETQADSIYVLSGEGQALKLFIPNYAIGEFAQDSRREGRRRT